MNITKEYEREEGIIALYHILLSLSSSYFYPKGIETKLDELIEEIFNLLEKGQPNYDIEHRQLIERITFNVSKKF